jgi:hypothetical protein
MQLLDSCDFDPRSLRDMALAFRPEVFAEEMKREIEMFLSRGDAGYA